MWSICLTLLILGFTTSVYMETCPEEEEIFPCVCDSGITVDINHILIQCSNKSLNFETLKNALSSLSGKNNVYLWLSGIDIGKLPSDFLAGIGIRKLSINYGSLESLTKDDQTGLIGLEEHLEVLRIVGSITKEKEPLKLNLGHLKKLSKLTLLHNTISELRDDWLSNAPSSLEILYMEGNGIKKIGNNAFAELNNLWSLELKGNAFGTIKRSMLPTTADRLKFLELDNSGLTDLPEDIFTRMPRIFTVTLKGNKIKTLQESTWTPIWRQLSRISLDENDIICDEKLNWILKSKNRPRLYGTCKHPKDVEGDYLEDYLERRTP